jgi:F-type H+-transporting ATPase subunit c
MFLAAELTTEQQLDVIKAGVGSLYIAKAIGAGFAALAVGFIGTKAAEGVSRNPAAATKILVQSILGMALAEGLGLLSILMIK